MILFHPLCHKTEEICTNIFELFKLKNISQKAQLGNEK